MDARAGGNGPHGPDERAQRALARLRITTRLMDQAFGIPGTKWRFGLDGLFGLVPGLGDIVGALIAVYALRVARMLRAPGAIQLHMLGNIVLDATVGTVPVIGDIFDFVYKAQTRNLELLDDWLETPHETARRSRRGLVFLPLAIVGVFAALTIFGVWMIVELVRWLASLFAGL